MKRNSSGLPCTGLAYLTRGVLAILLGLVIAGSASVRAEKLPARSVPSIRENTAGQIDDQTAINGLIKVYFKQYADAVHLQSLTLLGMTIEGDRAYAVGLIKEPALDGKTMITTTIGFVLERIQGSQWSIQPANRLISVQEINLPVPFTSQVPPGDWVSSTNCGQTSSAMVFAYYGYYKHTPANSADITDINAWLAQAYENPNYLNTNGYYTTTERVAFLARNYAHFLDSYSDENMDWTPDRIKQEILAGRPVIVATFTNMDMVKAKMHLMVVRGVRLDANGNVTQVIVNDPGRSIASGHGENYSYDVATFETVWARNNKAIVMIIPSPIQADVLEPKARYILPGNH